jgi:hypothetical protein
MGCGEGNSDHGREAYTRVAAQSRWIVVGVGVRSLPVDFTQLIDLYALSFFSFFPLFSMFTFLASVVIAHLSKSISLPKIEVPGCAR